MTFSLVLRAGLSGSHCPASEAGSAGKRCCGAWRDGVASRGCLRPWCGGGFLRRRKLVRKPERSQESAELRDSVCVVAIAPGARAAPTGEAAVRGEPMGGRGRRRSEGRGVPGCWYGVGGRAGDAPGGSGLVVVVAWRPRLRAGPRQSGAVMLEEPLQAPVPGTPRAEASQGDGREQGWGAVLLRSGRSRAGEQQECPGSCWAPERGG